MKSRTAGAAWLMAATALIWSSGGLAIKCIDLGPLAITGVRSALACLTLLAIPGGRPRGRLSRARLGAALGYAGLLVTNVAATKLTTAANAILLTYTAPLYVALLAPAVLGERTRRLDWLFILAVFGGMLLFFQDNLSVAGLWGTLLAMAAGLCYAVFTLCMRGQKDGAPLPSVTLGHAITAAVCLPFLFYENMPTLSGWLGLLYLGVPQQGLSLALYAWCIKRLSALEAILIMTLEPICNPVWVALGYGELPGPWAMAGGLIVVAAVTLRGVAQAARPGRIRSTA